MKIGIINISDIHFGLGGPESEGLVLDAFVNDVLDLLNDKKYEDIYFFIGGDLINIADSNKYSLFDTEVIKPIVE